MGQHRATRSERRSARAARGVRAASPAPGGRRRAASQRPRGTQGAQRSSRLRALGLPSGPVVAGVTALVLSAAGAVTTHMQEGDIVDPVSHVGVLNAASSLGSTGVGGTSTTDVLEDRQQVVSRDSQRQALEQRTNERLVDRAEAQAEQRNAALKQFRDAAEKTAAQLKLDQWVLPLGDYEITADFGQSSGLWAHTHTGLDFAAPSGTPIVAVAGGQVTETGYDGSYGNKTVITLDDGTEMWYCHQTSFTVKPGDAVRPGQQIGTVGSTGNSTGPHLHLEVRPGAGDPVDPFTALLQHGLTP